MDSNDSAAAAPFSLRAWWLRHARIAAARWLESALLPLLVYFAVRPFGVLPAILSASTWQLGVALWRHRRHGGGIATLALVVGTVRFGVALISVEAVLWLPVISGVLVGTGLLSGLLSAPILRDLDIEIDSALSRRIIRWWGLEQYGVAGLNAALVLVAGVDVVMAARPLIGAMLGAAVLALTVRRLNQHLRAGGS